MEDDIFSKIENGLNAKDFFDLYEYHNLNNYTLDDQVDKLVVKFIIAGTEKKDIKLSIKNDILYLDVERGDMNIEMKDSFQIPDNVSLDSISSKYKEGILLITMPKLTGDRNRNVINID